MADNPCTAHLISYLVGASCSWIPKSASGTGHPILAQTGWAGKKSEFYLDK